MAAKNKILVYKLADINVYICEFITQEKKKRRININ